MSHAAAALAAQLEQCRVTRGEGFSLDAHDPRGAAPDGIGKDDAPALIEAGIERLKQLQELLYADARWSVLVVLQGLDAAGKDGTIQHVMSGVNPQGVTVTSFKVPGPEDLAHDVLWRTVKALPARGMIGIFNRSHYEEVLVPRVRPEVLARQRLPAARMAGPGFWDGRLEDIAGFERHLDREGTRVVKCFLNISRDEQKKRLLARLDDPAKLWKFDPDDVATRALWEPYREAYQHAIAATATPEAPWYIIPADRKWLMRLLVMQAVVDTLVGLDLQPVQPTPDHLARLAEARRRLEDGG